MNNKSQTRIMFIFLISLILITGFICFVMAGKPGQNVVTGAGDSPDPQVVGNDITFVGTGTSSSSYTYQLVVCNTSGFSGDGLCDAGATLCTSSAGIGSGSQASCTYTAQSGDVGTSPNSYWVNTENSNGDEWEAEADGGGSQGTFTVIDKPTFSNPAINDSDIFNGDYVNHSITISGSPTQYLFSWNASGANCDTWVNSSWINVGESSVVGWNASIIPSACKDKTIGWKFYANNSVGINSSITQIYNVNSYGWLNVSIQKPDDNSNWVTGNNNLTINTTVTCEGGANAKCGTVYGLARYNLTANPDTDINITEGASPFYITEGEGGGGWNLSTATYDNINIPDQGIGVIGLFFKPDGIKLYESSPNTIYQSTCSDAWNLSSCTYDSVSISTHDGSNDDIFFKSDGTKLYEIGSELNLIHQSTCSDAWNLSSCTYDSVSISIQASFPYSLFFKPDGIKLYEVNSYAIYQSTCSDAWNLSSCTYDSVSISTQGGDTRGFFFKPDGTKFYEMSKVEGTIYQSTCSDAWNLSSSTYDSVNISTQEVFPYSFFFKSDGTKLYEGSNSDGIYQSSLEGGVGNLQSTILNKDDIYQFNWILNVTSASTESYLIDVKFNSSYGNALVPDNNTADRTVNLNPSGEDTIKPTYSLNQTNNTIVGKSTLFSIYYNDNTALHPNGQYIFSTNNSGTWTNESLVNFTVTPNWANVTKTLNSTEGISIGYRWYADDNAGNINDTGIFTLTTTSDEEENCWTETSGKLVIPPGCKYYTNVMEFLK